MINTRTVIGYGGQSWEFEVLPGQVNIKAEHKGDIMVFSAPTRRATEIERKIRFGFGSLSPEELMACASIIGTFRELMYKPAKKQRAVMVALRRCIDAESAAAETARKQEPRARFEEDGL